MRRRVVILGSTGSIGTQALDVIAENRDRFEVVAIAAGGGRPGLLAEQAQRFGVEVVGVADPDAASGLRGGGSNPSIEADLLVGPQACASIAELDCDVVLNAMTGAVGLRATMAGLHAGRTVALANKESLVIGGTVVTSAARPGQLVPVDSEHTAIAQCLRAGAPDEVSRLVLTASGGPFRGRTRAELADVTVEQALAHPNWDMGPVITINSATLVNKGLEVIEAQLLFGIPMSRIDVVVHPQSRVHSMVEFVDGSTIAQTSPPSMRQPIAMALAWPGRVPAAQPTFDWTTPQQWTFEALDDTVFPAVAMARRAGEAGGIAPATYNAANEVAVQAFRDGRLPFTGIDEVIAEVLQPVLESVRDPAPAGVLDARPDSDRAARDTSAGLSRPEASAGDVPLQVASLTLDDVLAADAEARDRAAAVIDDRTIDDRANTDA